MALKHRVAKVRCLWHGHEPVPGCYYSEARGRWLDGVVCNHCLKVL